MLLHFFLIIYIMHTLINNQILILLSIIKTNKMNSRPIEVFIIHYISLFNTSYFLSSTLIWFMQLPASVSSISVKRYQCKYKYWSQFLIYFPTLSWLQFVLFLFSIKYVWVNQTKQAMWHHHWLKGFIVFNVVLCFRDFEE